MIKAKGSKGGRTFETIDESQYNQTPLRPDETTIYEQILVLPKQFCSIISKLKNPAKLAANPTIN